MQKVKISRLHCSKNRDRISFVAQKSSRAIALRKLDKRIQRVNIMQDEVSFLLRV